jgi:hypothetical protein
MTDQSLTTSWIWSADEGINGLRIDTERGTLEWMDGPGCACGDSLYSQPYRDFLARGPKLDGIPDDVLAEIRASVTALDTASAD